MCLQSIGFAHRRESDALRETGAGQMPFGIGTAESRRRGANAGLGVYYAQDPVPSGQSLKDVGLSVGFVSHWF